jgi:hypothetical protein
LLSIDKQKHLALNIFCYLEAGARRNEGERSGKFWQGAQDQFLVLYPQYHKASEAPKWTQQKAEVSVSTKLRSQVSFSAQLHQNIKFHWLSGVLDSF